MEKLPVNVSSVRSLFETGKNEDVNDSFSSQLQGTATGSQLQGRKVSFNAKSDTKAKPIIEPKPVAEPKPIIEPKPVCDGPKRATLVREIEALPKNSVLSRLKMFEGGQAASESENKTEVSPPVAVPKPVLAYKPDVPGVKPDVPGVKPESVALQPLVKKASFSEKADVRNKPANKLTPPRPPPPRKTSTSRDGSDNENTDYEQPIRHSFSKAEDSVINEASQPPKPSPKPKKPVVYGKSILAGEEKSKDSKPNPQRPPPPTKRVSLSKLDDASTNDAPFKVTLVSKVSSQIILPSNKEKNDNIIHDSCLKSNGLFLPVEKSPSPMIRQKKPREHGNSSTQMGSDTDKTDVAAVRTVDGDAGAATTPINLRKCPPQKPPPPKPPRTFEHDAYLMSKKVAKKPAPVARPVANSNTPDNEVPKYELYDSNQHEYEIVESPPKRNTLCNHSMTSSSSHNYETLRFSANPRLLHRYNSQLSSGDRSSSSGSYSSVAGSLHRSASDECLYAKPSSLRLVDPMHPIYAKSSKKPPVPPKVREERYYASPYEDETVNASCGIIRSRSFLDQFNHGIAKLDDRLKNHILFAGVPPSGQHERRPAVDYRKSVDVRSMSVKPQVYVEVRQQVDEAYSQLHYHDIALAENATTEQDSDDSDSQIDISELQRRILHVSTVREQNRSVYEKMRLFKDKLYPSLFQYALVIGMKMVDDKCVPEILFSFPNFVSVEEAPIPDFCFPDKSLWLPVSHYDSETFSFVLTRQDGSRDYGYCRRLLPRYQTGPRLPIVICIVSPLGAHQLYTQVLDEVEKRLHISRDYAEELIQAVYARPLPTPGRTIHVKSMNPKGLVEVLSFTRASDMRLENVNFDTLFSCLSIDSIIKVFSSVLLERRILLAANKLSTLTNSIHALVSLLYPLQWEHTFIPVLPQSILEMTCSPTPYIIGVLSVHLKQIADLPTEEMLIVDLDTGKLRSPYDDEMSIIPKKLQKALSTVVKIALEETDSTSHKNLMLSEAFLRLFVESIGHYTEHIITLPEGERKFVKETFCKAVTSKSLRMFLEWLTETHLFQLFVMAHLDPDPSSLSLFDTRIMEHRENLANLPPNPWLNFRQWAKKMGKAIKTNIKGQGDVKKK